ncbi:MAG: NAD-dependent epimerase/dehydratase family protein, partial [Vicinamibacterales bacterium]
YGTPPENPIPETTRQEPVNPYGESKLFIERMLQWNSMTGGLQYVALRYFNAAGAAPDGVLGEDHSPEPHLIPNAIAAALGRRTHLDVFGTDYPTPDGTAIRDYTHVDDLARAHISALRYLESGQPSTAVNLGSGKGASVREVVKCVEAVGGRPVPVREQPRRPGDPAVLIADPRKAANVLGWRTQCSGLQTIVETAWRWHASQTRKG